MKENQQSIELLAPARNVECGIEAINCGADAVYIGASDFGARADATNSLEDIAKLTNYAHHYGAKVYVALNTILYTDELEKAHKLALDLATIGVDALITQDIALTQMNLPIPLNASTQMNNRTPQQVQFLSNVGFKRIILARELSIDQIKEIHQSCSAELEVFVHGAVCVSYSGQCYASQYCFGRSANRGTCAQFCRLPFDLEDENGNVLVHNRHLLSLKDMNRSASLEELMDAGVTSFKIEGRLKDVLYVKNITAYYRKQIDQILKRRTEFRRASYGKCQINFDPQPLKTFNRGYSEYFLHGSRDGITSIYTPKSIGEPVGHVKDIKNKAIRVAGTTEFHNGDGLCFFDEYSQLQGFRVNRAENNILYLAEPVEGLRPHTPLFRNYDTSFARTLLKSNEQRTLWLDITLSETADGYTLHGHDEAGNETSINVTAEKQDARTSQYERIRKELQKLGGTGYEARNIEISFTSDRFIPASHLSTWRRELSDKLSELAVLQQAQQATPDIAQNTENQPFGHLTYLANVANETAQRFYVEHGATEVDPAFELEQPEEPLLMTCKYCIRYALGYCRKTQGKPLPNGARQLFLVSQDGKRFHLEFDCSICEMKIYACH